MKCLLMRYLKEQDIKRYHPYYPNTRILMKLQKICFVKTRMIELTQLMKLKRI